MMSSSFADCHIECVRPDAIRAMYLVDCDAYDKDKINNPIDDNQRRNSNN
jgi:hypothetical protein